MLEWVNSYINKRLLNSNRSISLAEQSDRVRRLLSALYSLVSGTHRASPARPAQMVNASFRPWNLVAGVGSAMAVACCAAGNPLRIDSLAAIELCLSEAERIAGVRLPPDADRAYAYAKGNSRWVYFTHGDAGRFGKRSDDYRIVMVCGVQASPRRIMFMGLPLEEPMIDRADRSYFDSPQGSVELMFKRVDDRFEYCCLQPFDKENIRKGTWRGQTR